MNNKRWLARCLSGLYCAAAIAATVAGQRVRAQEEAPPLPPEHRVDHLIVFDARQMTAIERAGESLLRELGPGFTVTVTKSPACAASACSAAASSCGAHATCDTAACRGEEITAFDAAAGCFVKQACPCAAGGKCECGTACKCKAEAVSSNHCLAACSEPCSEAVCGEDACDLALAHAEEESERHHEHFQRRVLLHHEQADLVHHLVELVADRAAARTELECRREASAKMADLYETLAELIAANAALEAKLEAQAEHTKTLFKVAELAAENARLKTHVELAGTRSDSSQQMISLTLENERLKLRLADLEHRHAASEASQTAERTSRDRQSR